MAVEHLLTHGSAPVAAVLQRLCGARAAHARREGLRHCSGAGRGRGEHERLRNDTCKQPGCMHAVCMRSELVPVHAHSEPVIYMDQS